MAKEIRAVIFDMGGVLLTNRIEEILQGLAGALGIDKKAFREFQLGYHDRMIRGRLSVREFAGMVDERFGLGMGADRIIQLWKRSYLEVMSVNEGILEIVRKLKEKGYKLGIISNVPDLHAQINRERNLFRPFDVCILSCEVGLTKPQEEVFRLAASRLGLMPEECVFIDDREKYLSVPRKMGFRVIQYKGNEELISELGKTGVVV